MLSKASPRKTHIHAKTFQWRRLSLIYLRLALCFLIIGAFYCACCAEILALSLLILILMDGRSLRFSSGSFSTSPFSWHLSVLLASCLNLGLSTLETATELHVLHILYVNMHTWIMWDYCLIIIYNYIYIIIYLQFKYVLIAINSHLYDPVSKYTGN